MVMLKERSEADIERRFQSCLIQECSRSNTFYLLLTPTSFPSTVRSTLLFYSHTTYFLCFLSCRMSWGSRQQAEQATYVKPDQAWGWKGAQRELAGASLSVTGVGQENSRVCNSGELEKAGENWHMWSLGNNSCRMNTDGRKKSLLASPFFIAWFTLEPWMWRQYIPPKHKVDSAGLHGVTFQTTELILLCENLRCNILLISLWSSVLCDTV
jgi:hypothetical protein